ncbi:prenyltransferase [Candidatus Desantisbacteria bacterium]|nr:prenyltransferase [Candidatus Desantisbacteria bacterium]
MAFKDWFFETRPQFLILSVILVLYGSAVAFYHNSYNLAAFILLMVGLISMHLSCNVLNDYYDYKSGIDLHTAPTPFSGGSGFLPSGKLNPSGVFILGISSALIGIAIGVYFCITVSWALLPIVIAGAISVLFYNTVLTKIMLGEIFAGFGLGLLPIMGIYFVYTGRYDIQAVFAGVPPFLLVFNLLLLNEFPDAEADKKGGRKHIVIVLGPKIAAWIYTIFNLSVYIWVIFGILSGIMPVWTLLCLLTLPLAFKAIEGALKFRDNREKFIPAQGANVGMVLITQVLLAIGYLISHWNNITCECQFL